MGSWTVRTTSAPCSVLFGSARPPGGPSPVDRRNAQVGSLLSPIPIIISVQQCRPSWDVPVVLPWGSKWHLKLHSEVGAVPRQVDVYRAGGGSRQGPESREQRTTSGCNLGVCANGVAAAAACLHTALPLACCQVFAEILPPAPDSSPSQKKKEQRSTTARQAKVPAHRMVSHAPRRLVRGPPPRRVSLSGVSSSSLLPWSPPRSC